LQIGGKDIVGIAVVRSIAFIQTHKDRGMDDLEYDQEDDFNAAYSDDLEDDREIEQDMVWHVIDKYFHTKGLSKDAGQQQHRSSVGRC
jgi:hypothetical protein